MTMVTGTAKVPRYLRHDFREFLYACEFDEVTELELDGWLSSKVTTFVIGGTKSQWAKCHHFWARAAGRFPDLDLDITGSPPWGNNQ